MARVTVEDCLDALPNRFALVILASQRAKQLLAGQKTLLERPRNKEVINSLREVAAGKIISRDIPEAETKKKG